MNILMTNDDGIDSMGLIRLAVLLQDRYNIIISAPDSQRSASGHSITIKKSIQAKRTEVNGFNGKAYSIGGTPADCVKIGIEKLAGGKVDMVLSGINKGYNLGTDILYSGTVSAAMESSFYGIPAIALSMSEKCSEKDYENVSSKIIEMIDGFSTFSGGAAVINVNFPDTNKIKGIKLCRMGSRVYNSSYEENIIDGNTSEFLLTGSAAETDTQGTDIQSVYEGFISVTPLHYDMTDYKSLDKMNPISSLA